MRYAEEKITYTIITRLQLFNTTLINKYKQYRNKLSEMIKKQKLYFYGEIVKKNNRNPKKLWSTIKEITT